MMNTSRLEAFSDAVIAVIITIMVLELKAPQAADLAALQPLMPVFLAYVLSFVVIGSYWNNHHQLVRAASQVNPRLMWHNLHFLFWLSLIPFFTAWLGENYRHTWPTALYGALMVLVAIAYQLLQKTILANGRKKSTAGGDLKGALSLLLYGLSVIVAFIQPWLADILFGAVALMWFVPDQRFVPPTKASERVE